MRSITAASDLIATSDRADAITDVLRAIGFPDAPLELDALACERLGLSPEIRAAAVATGEGVLRALVVTLAADARPRDVLARVAARLEARVPHLLWLVLATQDASPLFAVAAWSAHVTPPRVYALVSARDRVVESDAETLCALAGCATIPGGDVMRHARWLDVLGRGAVTRRFFRALDRAVGTLAASLTPAAPPDDARMLALLYASRLLFLSFLETKGWLNGDFGFLVNGFADCVATGGRYQRRVLEPLFFGTLNARPTARAARAHAFGVVPFLNGGLFARSPLERRLRRHAFSDDALGGLYDDVLTRYRFTAREDTSAWSEAAVDPEMLGKAFESLMGDGERKRSGAFYTPQALVERVARHALAGALGAGGVPDTVVGDALIGNPVPPQWRGTLLERAARVRLLDPACGSGAFLVYALEQLAALQARLGDVRPLSAIRRSVLTTSIYGVDVNATAVWLCELRLWLSVVIESDERDPWRVLPLPNLDHQIRVGDSLAGSAFATPASAPRGGAADSIAALRQQYARAHGPRKKIVGRRLERLERARALAELDRQIAEMAHRRRERVCATRDRDLFSNRRGTSAAEHEALGAVRTQLRRLRDARRSLADGAALPFTFAVHFADVADAGGFDAVFGNPPWVRLHHIPRAARASLRERFVTYRHAAWREGAAGAAAGAGFAAQVDLAALFVERAAQLLAPDGTLAFLLPAKLWRSLAGGGTRAFLTHQTQLLAIEDLSDSATAFEAAVYPSILAARCPVTPPIPSTPPPGVAPPTATALRQPLAASNASDALPLHASKPDAQLSAKPPSHDTSTDTPCVATAMPTVAAVHRGSTMTAWPTSAAALALDGTPGSPWLIIPRDVRAAFDVVANAGTPLGRGTLGRPLLGVKTGCNAAFMVRDVGGDRTTATVAGHDHAVETIIERAVLRPLLRGERVRPWALPPTDERIIWTHGDDGLPLATLPPETHRWMAAWERRLTHRSDARANGARSRHRWWALFRTEGADRTGPRVVWGDFGRSPRAAALEPGDPTVPLNTCYVVRCETMSDADALTALLNSPLVAAWLDVVAEPALGGYRRYLGWTMALLPVPQDWPRARALLSPLGDRARRGHPPSYDELHHAVLVAYALEPATVAPLMAWSSR